MNKPYENPLVCKLIKLNSISKKEFRQKFLAYMANVLPRRHELLNENLSAEKEIPPYELKRCPEQYRLWPFLLIHSK